MSVQVLAFGLERPHGAFSWSMSQRIRHDRNDRFCSISTGYLIRRFGAEASQQEIKRAGLPGQ